MSEQPELIPPMVDIAPPLEIARRRLDSATRRVLEAEDLWNQQGLEASGLLRLADSEYRMALTEVRMLESEAMKKL